MVEAGEFVLSRLLKTVKLLKNRIALFAGIAEVDNRRDVLVTRRVRGSISH